MFFADFIFFSAYKQQYFHPALENLNRAIRS